MALQEAAKRVTRAKVGAFGTAGSGKTTTLSQLAIAVSKDMHQSAPVAFFATEPGVDYVMPQFEAEGVKLYVERSRAFSDLIRTVDEAQKLGCCALIVDSITHVWTELVDAFCEKRRIDRPEFQHWRVIKGDWQKWATIYVNAPMHIFVAGRAGFEYETEVNEKGKKEIVKGDSKMKAEGEFGYEADLLLELSSQADKQEQRKARGTKDVPPRMLHCALVRKSRVWELNGKEYQWADRDRYQAGDYKLVADCFRPYLGFLNAGATQSGPIVDASRSSEARFDTNGDGEWSRRQRDRQIALEDFTETVNRMFGGQDNNAKRARSLIVEAVTGHRSKTAVESMKLDELQFAAKVMRQFEKHVSDSMPQTSEGLLAELDIAKQSVNEEIQQRAADEAEMAANNPF